MSKKRVLVTTPAKNGVPHYWIAAYDDIMRTPHPDYEFAFAVEDGNNAINLYRNIICDYALRENFWKIVMLDADMFWTRDLLLRLISHNEPVVGCIYCKKKTGNVQWLAVRTPGVEAAREDGLLQCDFIGTGALAIEIDALRTMNNFFPERQFIYEDEDGKQKTMHELFPIGIVGPNTPEGRLARIAKLINDADYVDDITRPATATALLGSIRSILTNQSTEKGRLLGEDYGFTHLARKAGFKVWADTKCIIGHVGSIVYPVGNDKLSVQAGIPTHSLSLNAW